MLEFGKAAGSMESVTSSKGDPMQIGSLGTDHSDWTASDTHSRYIQPTMEKENVWADAGARTCFTCGGKRYIAKDCPSKRKGKALFLKRSSKGSFSE